MSDKTLAERAEEARVAYQKESNVWWKSYNDSKAQPAIEYFKRVLPEVKYIGDGKFELDGEVYEWREKFIGDGFGVYGKFIRDEYELHSFSNYYFTFSNLAEYGKCLKEKRERK